MGKEFLCETCNHYVFDETEEEYICVQSMDEDDYYRVYTGNFKVCPYYVSNDEYQVVRRQM